MERTAVRRRLNWQTGTVEGLVAETQRTRSISLDVPGWHGHRAGQHVDVRLTAEDGYQAQRSYSIASAPEDDHLVLTVERLDDGEVSPFLVDELRIGDELELRGPIGGYFVWDAALGGPLLLVAGGSGVVPFRAMLRHHRAIGSTVPVRLLYSARSLPDVVYREELTRIAGHDEIDVRVTLTREQPCWAARWRGAAARGVWPQPDGDGRPPRPIRLTFCDHPDGPAGAMLGKDVKRDRRPPVPPRVRRVPVIAGRGASGASLTLAHRTW